MLIDQPEGRSVRAKTRSHMTKRRLILLLVLGCVVLNLAMDGALGLALRQSRKHYEEGARTNVSNLSKVLEQNVLTLIKEIDLTLKTAVDEGTRLEAITRPGNPLFVQFLNKHSARIPDILGLRVIDRTGNVIYSTREGTNTRVNEGDREHFIRVRDDPNADLVITGPILGRVSHKWVLIFSRRMSRPDGSFSAEVHASVTMDTIINMFSAVDIGQHGVVSMWDKTTTLARYPEEVGGKSAIGTMKSSPQLKALLDAETKAAFYTAVAPIDNIKKSYAIRKVGQFPLWVIAGTAEEDYLAPWKSEVWQTGLAALLFAVITLIFAWQIYRYWRVGKLIRESEEQLSSAQALAHIGSWLKDPRSGEYVWSDETFRIFGHAPQSLTPDDRLLLAAVHQDDRQAVKEIFADLAQGKGNLSKDCRIVHSDGSVRWVHIEGHAEHGAMGIPDRISGFIRDISESKKAEAERLELERQRMRADRLEGLGTLAGGIAHDFNNLLQGVFGYIFVAKISIDDKEKTLAMLDQAEQALTMSVNLTTQLLTFAKGGKPIKKRIQPSSVIENVTKFALSGSPCDCRFTFDEDLWYVEADEGQIGQVIQNIVLNASEAMPDGGTVDISAKNLEVTKDTSPLLPEGGKFVVIRIKDSGTGIQEQYLSRVFDPYFTTKQKGNGLGLATSYSIIKNHDGEIEITSQVGKGTTFNIYLPAVEGKEEVQSYASVSSPGRKGRVLLMDDEEIVRKVATEMIAALGHEVESVEDGEGAIQLFRHARESGQPFDVVIMDLTVKGGMGGEQAIKEIREIDPEAKAIVSSGYSNNPVVSDYRSYGFMAFLNKPYRIESLRDCLNALIESH